MAEKMKKHQRLILIILIVICIGVVLAGGVRYLKNLQDNLADNAVKDVMNVTLQQNQAFDSFVSSDRQRLHGYAEYFAQNVKSDPEKIQQQLTMFKGIDEVCVVVCLDDGWACSNRYDKIIQLDEENLNIYRGLSASGVRDSFTGIFSGREKFGYYETFTFSDGKKGLIEKGYDRNKILKTFTLSLYGGQGYGYILNQNGDILLRSVDATSKHVYENVFDALIDTHNPQEDIDTFRSAINAHETGSIIFGGDGGRYVYTYAPVENVGDWYLLAIVPTDAIREEADVMLRDTQTTFWLFAIALGTVNK